MEVARVWGIYKIEVMNTHRSALSREVKEILTNQKDVWSRLNIPKLRVELREDGALPIVMNITLE